MTNWPFVMHPYYGVLHKYVVLFLVLMVRSVISMMLHSVEDATNAQLYLVLLAAAAICN